MEERKIKERILGSGLKQDYIAHCLGIKATSLTNKLKGRTDFKLNEIRKLKDILNLQDYELTIFF